MGRDVLALDALRLQREQYASVGVRNGKAYEHGCGDQVVITTLCVAPHGDELLSDDQKYSRLRRILNSCGSSNTSTYFIVSPHWLRIRSSISISWSERVCSKDKCYAVDRELAERLYLKCAGKGLPLSLANFGTDSGEASVLPLDWGSEIPLSFFPSARFVVIATPARDLNRRTLVSFGEAIAEELETNGEVGIIISADEAHAHSASGPYGYDPRADEFDGMVTKMMENGDLEPLIDMDQGLIDAAKPDSYWQLLIMLGILHRVHFKPVETSYQLAGYFGMLASRYARQ